MNKEVPQLKDHHVVHVDLEPGSSEFDIGCAVACMMKRAQMLGLGEPDAHAIFRTRDSISVVHYHASTAENYPHE